MTKLLHPSFYNITLTMMTNTEAFFNCQTGCLSNHACLTAQIQYKDWIWSIYIERHTNFSGKLVTKSIIIYKFSSKKKSSYSISVNSSPGRRKSEWQSGSPESTNRSLQSVRYRIVHEFLNIELLEHKRSGTYWFVDFRLAGWQRWECWGPDATPYRWF